jgi:transcriptional regulator with XRE-family HTH domain
VLWHLPSIVDGATACSRAYRLLVLRMVHTESQNIVRTIRRALDMTQAEFAHALGWSPSTISRWESGRAEPDRLSLKIILAFGEERRVRYRPRASTGSTLPAPISSLPATIGTLGYAPRPALEVLPPASGARPWGSHPGTERPRFEAALSFRVAVNERRDPMGARHPGWLRNGGIVAAALCAVTLIGAPMMGRSARPVDAPNRRAARVAQLAPVVAAAAPAAAAPVAPPPAVAPAPAPPPTIARLEGVTLLGDRREATFRIADEAVTIAEGQPLGDRRAARVSAGGVDLADAGGAVEAVRLGGRVALSPPVPH